MQVPSLVEPRGARCRIKIGEVECHAVLQREISQRLQDFIVVLNDELIEDEVELEVLFEFLRVVK